jgi:hypothetical protein
MEVSLLNRIVSYVIYGIIALGALGLISQLTTNTIGFLKQIAMLAVFAGIFYLIFRLIQGKANPKEQRAFRKAVRQSKKRTKERTIKPKQNNVANMSSAKSLYKLKARKKSDVQLTVIEGKKNKKKNRASF